jgi:Tol biopolymer transport system component
MDVVRKTEEPLTSDRGSEVSPVWIDDGRSMLFAGDSFGSLPHLIQKNLATREEQQVLPPGSHQLAMDFFPGGRAVAYSERGPGGFRLFQLPLAPGASPTPLLPGRNVTPYNTRLSPDRHAMSFVTGGGEGRMNVYVSTVPVTVTSAPELVAEGVLGSARWHRDGRRIYYVSADSTMMTLAVGAEPPLTAAVPQPLFKLQRPATLQDVFLDGRFLLLAPKVRAGQQPINVSIAAISSTRR